MAQPVKNPPAVQEMWVRFLSQEDSLEEGVTTHPSILAWRIPMDRGAVYGPWGHKELDTTEAYMHMCTHVHTHTCVHVSARAHTHTHTHTHTYGIFRAAGFQRMKLEPTLERNAVALGKNEKAAKIVNPQVAPVDKVVCKHCWSSPPPACMVGLSVGEFVVGNSQ